ncbi:MAG: pilus assembly protein [Bdellovibrionales bacterium]|nr:pilus assembly protein [Bdellovibrionales bacterium]
MKNERYRWKKKGWRDSYCYADNGATAVEAAIVIPILAFILLGFTEFVRYFIIYILVNYQAQDAVDFASRLQMRSDIAANCAALYPTGTKRTRCLAEQTEFKLNVQAVIAKALDYKFLFDNSTENGGSASSMARLKSFTYTNQNFATADVALIRPGDRLTYTDGGATIEHPEQPYYAGVPSPAEDFSFLLRDFPLMVYMEVEVDAILPFVSNYTARGFGFAFRRGALYSTYGSNRVPAPTPTPLPSGSSTPTPSGSGTPTPTSSPTPSNTPTPTPTLTLCQECSLEPGRCCGPNPSPTLPSQLTNHGFVPQCCMGGGL